MRCAAESTRKDAYEKWCRYRRTRAVPVVLTVEAWSAPDAWGLLGQQPLGMLWDSDRLCIWRPVSTCLTRPAPQLVICPAGAPAECYTGRHGPEGPGW
ncbi:hypothetical protein NDU88_005793 [Pleurodeles waltl]|uniref:Uncharacterized protein n=1 Tax=Pleurodeles waltl TaxID=8319 RepID=A0AAV7ME12_PLEWA|nr:hypothetical protein NDU88_005793 [Pleurodeles waltl]